jgi:hypothetical protein
MGTIGGVILTQRRPTGSTATLPVAASQWWAL